MSDKCEACGLHNPKDSQRVRTTNGGLLLCRQCLDDVNRKNPELLRLVKLESEWAVCIESLASAGYRLMQLAGGGEVERGNVGFACKSGMFHEEIAHQRIASLIADRDRLRASVKSLEMQLAEADAEVRRLERILEDRGLAERPWRKVPKVDPKRQPPATPNP